MSTLQDIYDQDFYRWAVTNAALIQQGRLAEVDMEHIAEEIEDMGINKKRAVSRHLMRLFQHLLKYRMQPQLRSKSWQLTIKNQREDLKELLAESPSLINVLHDPQQIQRTYARAVREAAIETGIEEGLFPQDPPFTLEQALDEDFLPDA